MSASNDKLARPEVHGSGAFPASASLVGIYGEPLFRILEQASSGYILLDAQGRAQRWNEGYLQLFPWLRLGLKVGVSLQTVLQAAASAAPSSASSALAAIEQGHQAALGRIQSHAEVQLPNGNKLQLSAHTLSANYSVIACKELMPHAQEGGHLAFFDTQTNLPNRRLLLDRLSQAMIQSERTGWRGALLTIDMESGGKLPQQTPALTLEIAQRLLSCVRACDTVAKIDAEHFVIMISDLSPDTDLANLLVERMGERLQERLNASYLLGEQALALEVNIGATLFGPHSRSATELLHQAETAMYRLRDGQERGLHFFQPEQRLQAPDRVRMEQELREALRLGLFELHYQAQYPVRGDINGLEALLRWRHPSRGLVPPSIFLPIAEASGIIIPLGLWSIQAACEQIVRWQADSQPIHLPVWVNISVQQLAQPDFVEQVESILVRTGIAASQLGFEISAKVLTHEDRALIPALKRLGTLGVRLTLDEFGSFACSQQSLSQIPLQQLKLSQTLVQRLGPNNASEAAVQSAINLANNAQMTVVATGVETLEQRALLMQYGCKHFMGYLFSSPLPAAQLKILLQSQSAPLQKKVA